MPEPEEDDSHVIEIIVGVFKSWFDRSGVSVPTEDLDDCAAEIAMILGDEGLLNLSGSPRDDDLDNDD
jgi:hypothetical protein